MRRVLRIIYLVNGNTGNVRVNMIINIRHMSRPFPLVLPQTYNMPSGMRQMKGVLNMILVLRTNSIVKFSLTNVRNHGLNNVFYMFLRNLINPRQLRHRVRRRRQAILNRVLVNMNTVLMILIRRIFRTNGKRTTTRRRQSAHRIQENESRITPTILQQSSLVNSHLINIQDHTYNLKATTPNRKGSRRHNGRGYGIFRLSFLLFRGDSMFYTATSVGPFVESARS